MTKYSNIISIFLLFLYSCNNTVDKKENSKQINDITKFRQLDTVGQNLTIDSVFKNKCQIFGEKRDFKNRENVYKTFAVTSIDKNTDTISYRLFSYVGWGNFYRLKENTSITISKYNDDYFIEIIEEDSIDTLYKKKGIKRIDSLQFKKLQEIIYENGFYESFSFHYAPCKLLVDGSFYIFEFNDGHNYKYFHIQTVQKKDINLFRQFLVIAQGYSETIKKIDQYHLD